LNGTGYAWNGLISVDEKDAGGNSESHFIDGIKYARTMESEEFEATLEAFSSPREFSACDGTKELLSGLFVDQQKRKQFGLSYRTNIGDAVLGLVGYKIHLVYNAMAQPSSRKNMTLNENAEPMVLSWDITARPERFPGIRPSAHFVVDTTRADPAKVTQIEEILYGTLTSEPRLPSAAELYGVFV
jgi:hypothetical protein